MSDNELTPESYPAKCTIGTDELQKLKEALMEHEDWKSHVEEWPPTDAHGNVYPIYFTVDELNSRGELLDSNYNNYNPFAGNLEPRLGEYNFCNAPLSNYSERYPEIRYCPLYLNDQENDQFCRNHKSRKNLMKTAEEALQTGVYSKSLDHVYENLGAWQQLFGWGLFESLLGESTYEFGEEYKQMEFDFSDEEFEPDGVADDGTFICEVAYPTQHLDPSLSLFAAAMMGVQIIEVQSKVMDETGEDEGMMESKTIETAQLTAPPSEYDSSPQEFKTLETWSEHHLNLPLSRLITDRTKLLKRGGVTVDPEDKDDSIDADEVVLEIEADADNMETTDETTGDPNAFGKDMTPQSQKIADNIENND